MEINKIPLSLVMPSPMNPRKTFNEEDLQELADNIEKQGLLQPITVRSTTDGKFEIICGERRYRALTILKAKEDKVNIEKSAAHRKKSDNFQSIAAIVREMTDEEAFDAMITENLQRKDVDPMEEAFAFGQLHKNGKSIEEIATRFGKSIRFVTERIKLNSLIPELMVAVKDEKMPIVAAQIICKLDDEQQRHYYNSYQANINGYTKATAQRFVDDLFMNIDASLWYQSDNQADEDFEGSCGRKCSDCPLNTANHGCLFYEMKCEDSGRCTDRERFKSKTVSYIMQEVERQSDKLIKVGEPLEYGKTVLAFTNGHYVHESAKPFIQAIRDKINSLGYEIVNPDKVFNSKCYYKSDDERTIEGLKSGELYRVISVVNFDRPSLNEEFWRVKKNSENEPESGVPSGVSTILAQIKSENDGLQTKMTIECAKAMFANTSPTNHPLTEIEKQLFSMLVFQSTRKLREAFGIKSNVIYSNDAHEFCATHPDIFNQAVRAWLQTKVSIGNNAELKTAEPMLDALGTLWCEEEYQKTKDKVRAKYNKTISKLVSQLTDLGYDPDGNPIPKQEPAKKSTTPNLLQKYDELKEKHPDTVILFKSRDEYIAIKDDAMVVQNAIKRALGTEYFPGCGHITHCHFPTNELDDMVHKLIKAGLRIAICENLDNSEKVI